MDFEQIGDEMLEDMFVKGKMPKSKDPFKKEEASIKNSSTATYDSAITRATNTSNTTANS